ncbi:MAG: S9 family peptidase [bacterium]
MRRTRAAVSWLAAAMLVAAGAGPASAQEKHPMTLHDTFRIVGVGGGEISPDGQWVLFSKSERDFAERERTTTWWLAPTDGSEEPFRFIGEEGGSGFTWAPDSKSIYFSRELDDVRQIFRIRLSGGEALPVTDWEEDQGSWQLSPDGSFFILRKDEEHEERKERIEEGFDHIYVNEGPNGQGRDSWSNLWKFDPETGERTRLTEREWAVGSWDISPDGSKVVLTARLDNLRNAGGASELYLLDIVSKEVRRLTDNDGPEQGPTWAPDSRKVLFSAVSLDAWDLGNGDLWLMDTESGEIQNLTEEHEGPISRPRFSPDGRHVYFTGGWGTARWPQRLEVATGRVEDLAESSGIMSVSSWSEDRHTYAYLYQDFTTPQDLYIGRVGEISPAPTRLTDANPWIGEEIDLGGVEVVRWESTDGFEIEGLLHTPPRYDPSDPEAIPLLLHIHGGPAGAFTNRFSPSNHVWAGLGYAQLSPNVRGSTGYSDRLMRGNIEDIGGGDYRDLMHGVDCLIERGIAHEDSLSLRGWSYGGILGGWTITQTDRFKAASVGAMVSDWTSEYGPGFNFDVSLWYIGGDPWSNPEEWREKSALTHVDQVTTPTLVLHGDEDTTDTPAQSMNFFFGLQRHDVPSLYVRFPGEPHGLRTMPHQWTRTTEEIEWMQKWVRGLEDYAYPPPPEKEEKEGEEEEGGSI